MDTVRQSAHGHKTDGTVVHYRYDAAGNRVEKQVVSSDTSYVTRYIRDASGNVLAIYQNDSLTEQPIYGSSRLGVYRGGSEAGEGQYGNRRFELANHLGSVLSIITDNVNMNADSTWATIVSAQDMFPFGLEMSGRSWQSEDYRHDFNGKETDTETGMQNYGMRMYLKKYNRFGSTDPKAEKFPYASSYNFVLNNPITNIDPDGAEVIIGFNKQTGKLAMIDLDHYKKELPVKIVSAKDYVHGGIRDDEGNLTHNQILVMDNVFSGGRVELDGTITRDLNRDKYEVAIPNESYDLTEYEGGGGWYKVDPIDESRYDDHHQGYKNADGETRSGYRFHLGSLSHGCITVCDPYGERQEEWDVVGKILENTSKTEVPKREGMQKYIPSTTRMKYGTINVTGTDRVKEVKKEE